MAEVEDKLALVMAELDQLRRKVLGPQSERMPSVTEELRKEQRRHGKKADPKQTREKRKANQAALKAAAIEHHVDSPVPDDQRTCSECGGEAKTISKERTSETWSYVPGYFRRNIVHCETFACDCGDYIVTAPPPARIFGQSKYDASFIAFLVVSKVCDSIPFYRQEERFKRKGLPIARTTMNTLLKRAGEELRILHRRMLERNHSASSSVPTTALWSSTPRINAPPPGVFAMQAAAAARCSTAPSFRVEAPLRGPAVRLLPSGRGASAP